MSKKYEEMKKELIEFLNEGTITENKIKLCNGVIALSNPKIRVYYNFSIASYKSLLENTTLEEIDTVLKKLDPSKQYAFKSFEELDEFLDFLLEEAEEGHAESLELYEYINKNTKKINNDLFMYEII